MHRPFHHHRRLPALIKRSAKIRGLCSLKRYLTGVRNVYAIISSAAWIVTAEIIIGPSIKIFVNRAVMSIACPSHFTFASKLKHNLNEINFQMIYDSIYWNLLPPACWHAAFLSQIVPSGHIPGVCTHPIVEFLVKPLEHVHS